VFERFHRGQAGLAGPAGTGLGLAIVREVAEARGGRASLHPRPGGGTTARIAFHALEDVAA
jgi:signal transduction histidine kinase